MDRTGWWILMIFLAADDKSPYKLWRISMDYANPQQPCIVIRWFPLQTLFSDARLLQNVKLHMRDRVIHIHE